MEISAGVYIIGLLILLFLTGTVSLILDSVFNKTQDNSSHHFGPAKTYTYKNESYTVTFEDD